MSMQYLVTIGASISHISIYVINLYLCHTHWHQGSERERNQREGEERLWELEVKEDQKDALPSEYDRIISLKNPQSLC